MSLYRDHGIVLRTHKLGEADRIVVMFTEGRGKVRAVAKGVRKTKSRFGARLEPISHVAVLMYEGRGELDIVNQAEMVDVFTAIRGDLDRVTRAIALAEAVDQLSPEREPNPRRYQMLLGALRTLEARDAPALVPAFFLKLLDAEGLRPNFTNCGTCGATADLVGIELTTGGVVCRADRLGNVMTIDDDTLRLMRAVLNGGLNTVLTEQASAATHQAEVVATRLLEHHLERRLRSVTALR